MHSNIALHWLTPGYIGKIPKGEIWVREDWFDNPEKMKKLRTHEKVELNLMLNRGLSYPRAHRIANKFEKNVKVKKH